jgi:signal transduction histidine kinase
MQQADGWQNPETLIYNAKIGLDAGSQLESMPVGSVPENLAGHSSSHSSDYLPWLEAVAPSNRRHGDQGLGGSGFIQQFHPLSPAENLTALIHDARNMVAAMDLYCDLLEEPGVLSAPFRHYAGELRLVGGASRRLLEKLAILDLAADWTKGMTKNGPSEGGADTPLESQMSDAAWPAAATSPASLAMVDQVLESTPPLVLEGRSPLGQAGVFQYEEPIQDLAVDLLANQNLLSAIAGPGVTVALSISGGHRPIAMAGDDLTRVLVNLCRNAVEAMPGGGHIHMALTESPESMLLTFTDDGPGIPEAALDAIFSSGFSSHASPRGRPASATGATPTVWSTQHRGLGLTIARSLVSAAGGSVWAANRNGNPESGGTTQTGVVISIEFPLRGSLRGT